MCQLQKLVCAFRNKKTLDKEEIWENIKIVVLFILISPKTWTGRERRRRMAWWMASLAWLLAHWPSGPRESSWRGTGTWRRIISHVHEESYKIFNLQALQFSNNKNIMFSLLSIELCVKLSRKETPYSDANREIISNTKPAISQITLTKIT